MFNDMHLWKKITIFMTLSLIMVGSIITYSNLHNMQELIYLAEKQELRGYVYNIANGIEAETRLSESLSALVANISLVKKSFADGDREALEKLLYSAYEILSKEYGVRQFQFHTPPAISFLRLHKLEKFGDDLSSFRHTVTNTNDTKKPTRGLESGVAGLGLRGMMPVFNDGKHLGSVEFGMSFGAPFFNSFKEKYGVEVGLYLYRENSFKTFASTAGDKPLMSTEKLKLAMAGEPQFFHVDLGGTSHAVVAEAIKDYSGKPIGVVEVAMDNRHFQSTLTKSRLTSIIIGLVALVLGIFLSILFSRSLALRLKKVVEIVDLMADGNLTVEIKNQSRDEIGQLTNAADRMQQQLNQLICKILEHAENVYTAAQQINAEVSSQAATSSQLSASVTEITSTMEELSASSLQISEYATSVVDVASHTLASSQQGSNAVQEVRQKMIDIKGDNVNSLHEIVELGSKSKDINRIMDVINALADQTKLIAFNAALEASSAGEAGYRFGVVASEIRRLADSVTESAGEIEGKINEIQSSISRLVVTSEKGAVGIDQGMSESTQTSEYLAEVVSNANETSTSAQQISISTRQQKTASDQVVVALHEIVSAAENTKEAVTLISEISQNMTELSADLKELVGQFKVSR
ncbi:methyl-accepting chemotaxis protein [bacterium]|nr:methyl-accepting chemotaxis protein [bacterium]